MNHDDEIRRCGDRSTTSTRDKGMRIGKGCVPDRPSVCRGTLVERSLRALVGGEITHAPAALIGVRRAGCGPVGKRAESHSSRAVEGRCGIRLRGG